MADYYISSYRRNFVLKSHKEDPLIEWMKDMLKHSFVLNAKDTYIETFAYFEELIDECSTDRASSRLLRYVPQIGYFHTKLPLRDAFEKYNAKYCIVERSHIAPSFNEFRHILNIGQVIAMKDTLKLITFDGDQTLYTDGGNFEENEILAQYIEELLKHGITVVVVTAAGYGLDGSKYAIRLQGLFDSFINHSLTDADISRFYVFGGECNYLLQCHVSTTDATTDSGSDDQRRKVVLLPVPEEEWQDPSRNGPKPKDWDSVEITKILDIAEDVMKKTVESMKLRAKILRKERAVGMFPGGDEMAALFPKGHGSKKLKREALDETVLRVIDALRMTKPAIKLPYCVFNGGRDAWLDIGNKSVAVQCLQSYLKLDPVNCLHVGDQFLQTGNDFAARNVSPCIWITSPHETEKILEHILSYMDIAGGIEVISSKKSKVVSANTSASTFSVYSGEKE